MPGNRLDIVFEQLTPPSGEDTTSPEKRKTPRRTSARSETHADGAAASSIIEPAQREKE